MDRVTHEVYPVSARLAASRPAQTILGDARQIYRLHRLPKQKPAARLMTAAILELYESKTLRALTVRKPDKK